MIFLPAGAPSFTGGLRAGQADLQPFSASTLASCLFVPAVSMCLWPRERKSGSIELLLTPASADHAVWPVPSPSWAFIEHHVSADLPTPRRWTKEWMEGME